MPKNNLAHKLDIDLPSYVKALILRKITHQDLMEVHLTNLRCRLEAENKTLQTYSNHRTAYKKWLEILKLSAADPVGEELGADFSVSLDTYIRQLSDSGLDPQTVRDRKSIIKSYRKSWLDLLHSDGLPETFKEALLVLMRAHGVTVQSLSGACNICHQTLRNWVNTRKTPGHKSLKYVHRLEDYFKLQRGTLTSRLPSVLYGTRGKPKACLTPWRAHQSLRVKMPYKLKRWPSSLEEEWARLLKFFTDSAWIAKEGFERKSSWRIRADGSCPTAEIKRGMLESFYGYLCLPLRHAGPALEVSGYDPRMQEGKCFAPEGLTLALVGDLDLTFDFLQFMRLRTHTQQYNSHTANFVAFCAQILRPQTGFLYQHPEFALRLPKVVPESEWPMWCEKAHTRLMRVLGNVVEAMEIKRTRDPFEPIRMFIEGRQHPVSTLLELAENIRRDKPSPICRDLERATHYRDLLLVELLTSNPLRAGNFSRMTFQRDGGNGDGRSAGGHLYKKPDGSWHLRILPEEFKNEKGAAKNTPYNVPVAPSLWAGIEEYLNVHRPHLLGAAECNYVFRPKCIPGMTPEAMKAVAVTAPMSSGALGIIIRKVTQFYLAEYGCVGFGPHCFRHIVATEWVKNHPDGYEVAAAILHDTPETVRKAYSWVTPADKIAHWNSYFESLSGLYREGSL